LDEIFSFLNGRDILRCCLINKAHYNLIFEQNCGKALDKLEFKLKDSSNCIRPNDRGYKLARLGSYPFNNVLLRHKLDVRLREEKNLLDFLAVGEQLTGLTLYQVQFNASDYVQMLVKCERLKCLKICEVQVSAPDPMDLEKWNQCFEKLSNIAGNWGVIDPMKPEIKGFQRSVTRLDYLQLDYSSSTNDAREIIAIMHALSIQVKAIDICMDYEYLYHEDITRFLDILVRYEGYQASLKRLQLTTECHDYDYDDLRPCEIDDMFREFAIGYVGQLKALLKMPKIQLTGACFSSARLIPFLETQTQLVDLEMLDEGKKLERLIQAMPQLRNLRILYLVDSKWMADEIGKLRNLERLVVEYKYNNQNSFDVPCIDKLNKLSVLRCQYIGDRWDRYVSKKVKLSALIQPLYQLRELLLIEFNMDHDDLQKVFKYMPNLRKLIIPGVEVSYTYGCC
jgi:hypothetical protein